MVIIKAVGILITAIEAIGKLIEERRSTQKKRHSAFVRIAKDIYTSLKVVHNDYLRFFEMAKTDLKSGKDPQIVLDNLRNRRLSEEAERHSVIDRTDAIIDEGVQKDEEVFLCSVRNYFLETPFSEETTPSTGLINALDEQLRYPSDHEILCESIEAVLDCIRDNWDCVSYEYGKLEAKTIN